MHDYCYIFTIVPVLSVNTNLPRPHAMSTWIPANYSRTAHSVSDPTLRIIWLWIVVKTKISSFSKKIAEGIHTLMAQFDAALEGNDCIRN